MNTFNLKETGIIRGTITQGGSVVDISAATTKDFLSKSPTGTVTTSAGSFTTDGTDGQLEVAILASTYTDAADVGTWELQAHIIDSPDEFYTEIVTFDVTANLDT